MTGPTFFDETTIVMARLIAAAAATMPDRQWHAEMRDYQNTVWVEGIKGDHHAAHSFDLRQAIDASDDQLRGAFEALAADLDVKEDLSWPRGQGIKKR